MKQMTESLLRKEPRYPQMEDYAGMLLEAAIDHVLLQRRGITLSRTDDSEGADVQIEFGPNEQSPKGYFFSVRWNEDGCELNFWRGRNVRDTLSAVIADLTWGAEYWSAHRIRPGEIMGLTQAIDAAMKWPAMRPAAQALFELNNESLVKKGRRR